MLFELERIDHVQLAMPVGEEEEARLFYGGILGFQEIEKPAVLRKRGGVWFQSGEIALHLGVEAVFTPAKKAHPAFCVRGVSELKAYLVEKSIHILEDDNLPGANRFYLHDPFGNRLEFLEWMTTS